MTTLCFNQLRNPTGFLMVSGPLWPALVGISRFSYCSVLPHTLLSSTALNTQVPRKHCVFLPTLPTSSYLSGLSKHVFPSKKPFLTPTSLCESPQCPELLCHSTYCTIILGYLYMHGPKLTCPMHLTLCVSHCRWLMTICWINECIDEYNHLNVRHLTTLSFSSTHFPHCQQDFMEDIVSVLDKSCVLTVSICSSTTLAQLRPFPCRLLGRAGEYRAVSSSFSGLVQAWSSYLLSGSSHDAPLFFFF